LTSEDPLVELARRTIETYVREGRIIDPPANLSDEMKQRRGVFVSLHRRDSLRGCIGTIEPVRPNLAQEIIANAISAAARDPRFSPVRPDELHDLDISVDVLSEPEPIDSLDQLDPSIYGVIVQSGQRRGLLLPDLEGVDSPEQQVSIALQKAWIAPHEAYQMFRFCVVRHH